MILKPLSWLTATLFYSTVVLVDSSFLKRSSNVCPSNNYTAPNGLRFTTKNLCLHDIPTNDSYNASADSLQACMTLCASAPNNRLCAGVAYNFGTGICFMKNEMVLSAATRQVSDTHSAIAVNLDQNPDIACPYPNGTERKTSNGMQYQVICDQNMLFNDYCPLSGPTPQHPGGACPYHANNVDECMQLCSQSSPLCKAVTYNPDMYAGYGNCYVKTDVSPSDYVSDPPVTLHHTHIGVAIDIPQLNQSCTNSAQVSASNGDQFQISCNENRNMNDLAQVHAINLSSCIDACATFTNGTTGGCTGAVFDSTLASGWLNCWLKTAIGPAIALAGNHFALKTKSSTGQSSSPKSGSGGSSKAWIAGPIVGGLIGIVAFLGAIAWRSRRRRVEKQVSAPFMMSTVSAKISDAYRLSLTQVHHIGDPEPQEVSGHQIHELPNKPVN